MALRCTASWPSALQRKLELKGGSPSALKKLGSSLHSPDSGNRSPERVGHPPEVSQPGSARVCLCPTPPTLMSGVASHHSPNWKHSGDQPWAGLGEGVFRVRPEAPVLERLATPSPLPASLLTDADGKLAAGVQEGSRQTRPLCRHCPSMMGWYSPRPELG